MGEMKASRIRMGAGMILAVVLGAGGLVAAPEVASAAPWSVSALSDGTTAAQLASTLVGPGVAVDSVTFTGDAGAAGLFDDPAASVGLSRGVVMSTGRVHDVIGPNDSTNTGEDLGQPGDSQLDALLPSGQATQDAASLTVDFTPTNPQLAINYVFASEEYEEFVDSEFNDVFAFFVNGVNCATTPGTVATHHRQHRQSDHELALLRPERGRHVRHPVRRLHRRPHMPGRGQPGRQEHVAPRHRRHQ